MPCRWYQEPNWETGKNIWWQLKRADGEPWMIAGLWDEWTDPDTGQVVPSYTMITRNCDGHPLLARLHKPDPALPQDAQDKRSLVHVDPDDWDQWLTGSEGDARSLLKLQPPEVFDQADALRTNTVLAQRKGSDKLL
ncbi:SOS response-associated peptidase family protein [Aquabacterium sp. NJ1]|uniref:SOS response-associated peptidase family protein n=1 Tax=Aquabacterium sp. NJ1 TaxID=1538295 RepID=UPI001F2C66CA|nr:SOS response-associated peptidase family protein [Aquabacterium sp. NJ1]